MVAGAALLVVGVVALFMPVSVTGPESSIGCGNAVAADLSEARDVDNSNPANLPIIDQFVHSTDYVAECESALSSRRSWAIPVAVVGLVVLAGSFFVGGRGRVSAG